MAVAHEHNHVPDAGKMFAWAAILNTGFVIVEAGFGFATGSLALLADAAHNLTDVAGLLIAWGAAGLSRRQPTLRHTYGLGRATILAALANAIAILVGVGAIVWEAVQRFGEPSPVVASTVLWVAAVGIAVNAGTAMLFLKDRHSDLNARGAFLHMATDAAVSAGVVASALIILATGWLIVDPVTAIVVSLLVGWSAFDLFRSALHLSLDGVPKEVGTAAVERWLRSLPGVNDVHDLHVWSLSTTSVALTAHLVMPEGPSEGGFLDRVAEGLEREFHIGHSTIQIESGADPACRLASAEIP
ncbi:MAG: cation diffusion facilitator family transporter [Alphaproteobacteria bacterium]